MKSQPHHNKFALALLLGFATSLPAQAQEVILNATDTASIVSFNSAGNWSDGLAPSSDKDYVIQGSRALFTPASGDHIFAGRSLTLRTSGTAKLALNSLGTITIPNLIFEAGRIQAYTATANLAGNITLMNTGIASGDTGLFEPTSGRTINVSSTIDGIGVFKMQGGTVILSSQNSYSGGTRVSHDRNVSHLQALVGGALGTGYVTILQKGQLTLGNNNSGNFIADTATLSIGTAGFKADSDTKVALSFVGTEVIGKLVVNGTIEVADGRYSASELNSLLALSSDIFSGSGFLQIGAIPEPATVALLLGLGVLGMVIFRCS